MILLRLDSFLVKEYNFQSVKWDNCRSCSLREAFGCAGVSLVVKVYHSFLQFLKVGHLAVYPM